MSEIPIEGKVVGQIGEATYYEGRNYAAQMSFTREASGNWEEWINKLSAAPFKSEVLGQWFEYTPADELRDRLNTRLVGKDPGLPINWKGLK